MEYNDLLRAENCFFFFTPLFFVLFPFHKKAFEMVKNPIPLKQLFTIWSLGERKREKKKNRPKKERNKQKRQQQDPPPVLPSKIVPSLTKEPIVVVVSVYISAGHRGDEYSLGSYIYIYIRAFIYRGRYEKNVKLPTPCDAPSCVCVAGCEFPAQWNGRWFQSGNQGLVTVNGSMMTNKGRCIETKDDKFLIQDT